MSSILFPDDRVSNRTLNESPVEAIDAAINVVGEKKRPDLYGRRIFTRAPS